ncbi:hypothetical protein HCN44_010946 [Aphidius gifuensis]|uniref:Uncharacterized protein n=1 Tax=Aphidius gifuensis TaxID=684658 RepID=A0A835CYJ4_APHGI|nr:hypothetical protein HCN44_010946 [Aphidius gifuensis]
MSPPLRVRSWKRSQKYAFIKKSIEQEFKSLVSESSSSSDDIGEDISDDNRVNFGQDHNCVEFNTSDRACNAIELDDSSCEDSIDDFHNDGDLLDDICEYDEKNLILKHYRKVSTKLLDITIELTKLQRESRPSIKGPLKIGEIELPVDSIDEVKKLEEALDDKEKLLELVIYQFYSISSVYVEAFELQN